MINVLHLGLSYKCNMNCEHCYVKRQEDKLCLSDFYDIIETLNESGLFVLYYTFGEPLCSPLFDMVSSFAKEKGIIQVLMTNGSLINPDTINMIKRNNISKVCVSIDHIDPLIHDTNRKYKNAFNKAVKSLKMLNDNNIKSEISTTVNSSNVDCLNELYDFASDLDVNFISFLRQRNSGKINPLIDEKLYWSFFMNMVTKQGGPNVLFHDPTLLPLIEKMKKSNLISKNIYEKYYGMNSCHYSQTISIEPNGDVKRCNLHNKVIGNILHTPLVKIIEEESGNYDGIVHCSSISK